MGKRNILTRSRRKKAEALLNDRQFDEARRLFQQICKLDSHDADAWLMLGISNAQLGNLQETIKCNERAITLRPNLWEAHFNLGKALHDLGDLARAEASYRKTLDLYPGCLQALNNLGNLLQARGNPLEALACYRSALESNPDYATGYVNMAIAQLSQGNYENALHYCEQLEHHFPGLVDIPVIKAMILERQGQLDMAYHMIEPLIAQGKENADIAILFASLCQRVGRRDEAIAMLKRVLSGYDENTHLNGSASLHFKLGALYEAEHDYDEAFKHFRTANGLKRIKYDGDSYSKYVDKLIETFNSRSLRNLPRGSSDSERPVFIVGMPRSGTTLVEQILASHPQIHGAGELDYIRLAIADLPRMVESHKSFPDCLLELTQETYDQIAQSYLDHLMQLSNGERFVINKMPGNFLYLGFIALLFPRSRIIHCMRDPLDTCLSCYFSEFKGIAHSYTYNLEDLGHYYRTYERLMQHWNEILDIPVLNVSYEALISDQESMTRRLLDFLGLEWDDACLRFYENKRFVNTISYNQVRQPINTRSIGRWKHYEPYLAPLKTTLTL